MKRIAMVTRTVTLMLLLVLSATAKAQDSRGTTSAAVEVGITFNLKSAVSLSVESAPVRGVPCEGGTQMAQMSGTGNKKVIDLGQDISTTDPGTVSNGCAYRVHGKDAGLQIVVAVKTTVFVAGNPSASLGLAGKTGADWNESTVPYGYLKYAAHNGETDWRSSNAGQLVPRTNDAPAVVAPGILSGEAPEHQLAVFIPDAAKASGTKSAVVYYTVVAN